MVNGGGNITFLFVEHLRDNLDPMEQTPRSTSPRPSSQSDSGTEAKAQADVGHVYDPSSEESAGVYKPGIKSTSKSDRPASSPQEDEYINDDEFNKMTDEIMKEYLEGIDRAANTLTASTSTNVPSAPDWTPQCPWCGKANEEGMTMCDPVHPRICQGGDF